MKKNMGKIDKTIRFIAGIVLIILFFVLEGGIRWISLLGVVFLATSLIGTCPLYLPFNFSTKKKDE